MLIERARFVVPLRTMHVNDGKPGNQQLLADFLFVSVVLQRVVVVPAGFRTDFASVPRLPLAFWLFGGVADEAAVIHDWLYTNNVKGVTRKQADEVFAEAMTALGVKGWQRGPMWLGVRLFGGSHWGTGSPLTPAPEAEAAAASAD